MKKVHTREKEIEKISLTEEQRDIVLTTLKDSYVDQKAYNEEQIDKLDKLDKKISEEFWKEKHNEWQYEIAIYIEKK